MRRLSKFHQYLDEVYTPNLEDDVKQVLLIKIKLSDDNLGTQIDDDFFYPLEERLIKAIILKGECHWSGHETGQGYTTIFFYGNSADQIHQTIASELAKTQFPKKSYLIKYFGSENEKEVIALSLRSN